MKNLLVALPEDTHKSLKMLAVQKGASMVKIICALVEEYLQKEQEKELHNLSKPNT